MAYGKPTQYVVVSDKNFSIRNGKVYFRLNNKIDVLSYINSVKNDKYLSFEPSHHHVWSNLGSGVYIFTIENINTKKVDCAYVGCSKKLSTRINQHPVLKMLVYSLAPQFKSTLHIIPCEEYEKFEDKLIRDLNPFLNSEYKSIRKKNVISYDLPDVCGKKIKGKKSGHFINDDLTVGIYG